MKYKLLREKGRMLPVGIKPRPPSLCLDAKSLSYEFKQSFTASHRLSYFSGEHDSSDHRNLAFYILVFNLVLYQFLFRKKKKKPLPIIFFTPHCAPSIMP